MVQELVAALEVEVAGCSGTGPSVVLEAYDRFCKSRID